MTISTWLPSAVSSAGIIVALSAFIWQIRRARFNQSVDLLFKLENDFFGASKKDQRVKAAHDLLAGQFLEAEPILDFFETMALLLRRKALDKEMVWHTFSYWIDHYYEATKNYIQKRQKDDPFVWEDFVAFVSKLRKFQSERHGTPAYRPPSPEQVTRFLEEELTEATSPPSFAPQTPPA
jgi:hypothetical protein